MTPDRLDDHIEVVVTVAHRHTTERDGERPLVLVSSRDPDLTRSRCPRRCDAERSDRARSDDCNARARAHLGATEGADAHREGFGEHAEVEIDVGRQRPDARLRDGEVLGHAAAGRHPEQRPPDAPVHMTAPALAALAAPDERFHGDRRTQREVDVVTTRVDHARHFVPRDQSLRGRERSAEEVEVGAADPDRVHADANPLGSRFGNRSFDDLEVPLAIPHRSAHRYSFPHVRRRGEQMATYVMLSTLTDEGRKTLKQRPERLDEVNKEVESMGGRVTAQYAMIGTYDFVTVVEAPSNEVIARISVELCSRGTLNITTFPAISVKSFTEMLQNGQA